MEDIQNECKRCGVCCTKGGPALHKKDLPLIKSGKIPRTRLITIRKGELVHKPASDKPQAAGCELIKICGTGREWQCFYFNSDDKGCKIYANRPIACSTLQCWNTSAIEKLVETDTITRFDIVERDEPIYTIIEEHEKLCPCPDMPGVAGAIESRIYPAIESFEDLVNRDIQIRTRAVQEHNITLADELFFFGRPIFQLLQQLGVKVSESGGKLQLHWPTS
jgi:Fe-S-cluster containining protein